MRFKLKTDTPERQSDYEFVERTAEIVRAWPDWKRCAIGASPMTLAERAKGVVIDATDPATLDIVAAIKKAIGEQG